MSCELTVRDWIIVSHHLFTSVSYCCMNLDFLNMMVAKSFCGKEPSDLAVHCLKDVLVATCRRCPEISLGKCNGQLSSCTYCTLL